MKPTPASGAKEGEMAPVSAQATRIHHTLSAQSHGALIMLLINVLVRMVSGHKICRPKGSGRTCGAAARDGFRRGVHRRGDVADEQPRQAADGAGEGCQGASWR